MGLTASCFTGISANHLYNHQYTLRKTFRGLVHPSSSPRLPGRFGHSSDQRMARRGGPVPHQPLTSQSKLELGLLSRELLPTLLPVGKNFTILVRNFLPVGKPGLQMFGFQLLTALSPRLARRSKPRTNLELLISPQRVDGTSYHFRVAHRCCLDDNPCRTVLTWSPNCQPCRATSSTDR